jgi:hypothetical protein
VGDFGGQLSRHSSYPCRRRPLFRLCCHRRRRHARLATHRGFSCCRRSANPVWGPARGGKVRLGWHRLFVLINCLPINYCFRSTCSFVPPESKSVCKFRQLSKKKCLMIRTEARAASLYDFCYGSTKIMLFVKALASHNWFFIELQYMYIRGGRFLDFLDFQPVATGSRCKMLF